MRVINDTSRARKVTIELDEAELLTVTCALGLPSHEIGDRLECVDPHKSYDDMADDSGLYEQFKRIYRGEDNE